MNAISNMFNPGKPDPTMTNYGGGQGFGQGFGQPMQMQPQVMPQSGGIVPPDFGPGQQFGQAAPSPDAPDPMVARQEGLDGGHGNDGNRSRMGMARPGAPTWRGMNWADRLTALGAIVGDLDPRAQGRNYAGFREEFAGRGDAERERAKAEAEAARRQQFQQAYQASLGPDGQLDARKFAQLTSGLGIVENLGDVASMARLTAPREDRILTGADLNDDGTNDFALESVVRARLTPGQGQDRPGVPQSQGPAIGQRAVNPNDPTAPAMVWNGSAWEPEGSPRPTRAAPSGAATPQGQAFSSYGDLTSFLADFSPGSRVTSMGRSQAEQDALYRRGKTPTRNSTHVEGRGLGTDYVPQIPFDQWEQEAARLRATGRFRNVRIETGRGRNQGTGAHIHLEPLR